MPLIIAVTGSIAAGKSLLCAHLEAAHGALRMEADREVHGMYAPGTPGFARVTGAFGDDIVGSDGVIDRRALGTKVYGNAERMSQLRAAIGDIPAHFMALLQRWRDELPDAAVAVFEGVEVFENDYMRLADAGWLLVCGPETAISRMVASRGLSEADARQRLASSRDWRERAPMADHVFHNDGAEADLLAEVDRELARLKRLRAANALPEPRWRSTRPGASQARFPPATGAGPGRAGR